MHAGLRRFLRLHKQQFWLFGWDARRPEGNLLVELGFERTPVPAGGRVKSSRYHCTFDDGSVITLWSFGACWSSPLDGSIYVSRFDPRPRYHSDTEVVPDAWWPDDLAMFRRPRALPETETTKRLLLELLTWFGHYEAVVIQHCGCHYRQEALDAWRDPVGTGATLSEDWVRQSSVVESVLTPLPV